MIDKKCDGGERLLEIDNVHITSCGPPPSIDGTGKYVGYFENKYGEQWVFIGDPKTGKAVIRGGDCSWEREFEVSEETPAPAAILNDAEKLWIVTRFMAMSDKPFDEVVARYNEEAKRRSDAIQKKYEELRSQGQ